jgi:hypothetical protein
VPKSESLPTEPWTCDEAAYKRIISAVGEEYIPRDVDRDKFRNNLVFDLTDAQSKLLLFAALDSDKGARKRKELFGRVLKSAIDFRERLLDPTSDMYVARTIAANEGFSFAKQFLAFKEALDRIIKATEALQEHNSHGGWVRLERSPKEWFAGEMLPRVFERNFQRRPGASRPSDESKKRSAGGPYVRYAVAVMGEMGMKITRETVARILKDVQADRKARGRSGGRRSRKRRSTTLRLAPEWYGPIS